jgi:DNA-binding response OmpR family regulator
MDSKGKILLVEDEENFGFVLKNLLEIAGYTVDLAVDGNVGYAKFKSGKYELCLLDVMMPFKDGFSLAKEIRVIDTAVPIIFLTAKTAKCDKVKGYQLGADDYITKPFDSELLLLKMETVLRRSAPTRCQEPDEVYIGHYTFVPSKRMLVHRSHSCRLSPKEAQLLSVFCRYTNEVMPRTVALREIWNNVDYFSTRSMDVYVAKLRKRLKKDERIDIENIHAMGYLFTVPQ